MVTTDHKKEVIEECNFSGNKLWTNSDEIFVGDKTVKLDKQFQTVRQEFMEIECEALPGVAYPEVRDNRSTLNTKTRYDDDDDDGIPNFW